MDSSLWVYGNSSIWVQCRTVWEVFSANRISQTVCLLNPFASHRYTRSSFGFWIASTSEVSSKDLYILYFAFKQLKRIWTVCKVMSTQLAVKSQIKIFYKSFRQLVEILQCWQALARLTFLNRTPWDIKGFFQLTID